MPIFKKPFPTRAASWLAFACGAATVFAFAPFNASALPIVTLGVLFSQWHHAAPREAVRQGYAFGAGLFLCGVSWVYVALHTFGAMPAPVAALGTLLFCLYLGLFPALAAWLATRWTPAGSTARLVASAAAWPLTEWLRSWLLSGFPWLGIGYAALPERGAGLGAGYGPLGGTWLVSLAYAIIAAVFAAVLHALVERKPKRLLAAATVGVAVLAGDVALRPIAWTATHGAPLSVSLVQGNVGQDMKFDPALRGATFQLYIDLVRASRGRVVVLPESALPAFADEIPAAVLGELLAIATARDGMVMTGLFTVDPPTPGGTLLRYYNSVVSLGAGTPQLYRKRHLVPFGETIPLEPLVGWFIRSVLSIPLANQSAGAADQPAFAIGDQRLAVDICYEDVFGPDIRPQALAASMLVNVTNDAWYGHSLAARQHNQIAAMRALETGRPMLRATNTGITSFIGHDGREIARLPWFTRGTLEVTVQGRSGLTPYVRYGDAVPVLAALVALGAALLAARSGPRTPAR